MDRPMPIPGLSPGAPLAAGHSGTTKASEIRRATARAAPLWRTLLAGRGGVAAPPSAGAFLEIVFISVRTELPLQGCLEFAVIHRCIISFIMKITPKTATRIPKLT